MPISSLDSLRSSFDKEDYDEWYDEEFLQLDEEEEEEIREESEDTEQYLDEENITGIEEATPKRRRVIRDAVLAAFVSCGHYPEFLCMKFPKTRYLAQFYKTGFTFKGGTMHWSSFHQLAVTAPAPFETNFSRLL